MRLIQIGGTALLIAVGVGGGVIIAQDERALGGTVTVVDASEAAFTNPLPGFTEAQLLEFDEGDELFDVEYSPARRRRNNSTEDGLGPYFNAVSCSSCHVEDGRAGIAAPGEPQTEGLLIRLAMPATDGSGAMVPDPNYGGQLQDHAIRDWAPEGVIEIDRADIVGNFADGTPYRLAQPTYTIQRLSNGALHEATTLSPRIANQMIGLGLLDAVTEEAILANADPDDANGDGISGRPNIVWDIASETLVIGRFGWKSNMPNLRQQVAGAFLGDMGVTTSLFMAHECGVNQESCLQARYGGTPEVDDEVVRLVTLYSSSLSVPAQRNTDDPVVQQGEAIFSVVGCTDCHIDEMMTGQHPTIPQLSNQTIRPYTDLLLHDMGDGLADGQQDHLASGSEWRTPPLWGIGLFETVNGHTTYLHDGRARNLMEAVLWHGGEAEMARNAVLALEAAERDALIAFLQSL